MEYGKRKALMQRKPALVIAIGEKMAERPAPKAEEPKADDALTCPKCGAELKDTPENREYAKMRAEEMDESDDEMDEDEDEES